MQPTPEPKPATLDVELFLALLLAATRDAEGYKKTVARLQAESNKELHRHRRWWNKLKDALTTSRAREREALNRANDLEVQIVQLRRDVAEFMKRYSLHLGDNEHVRCGLERTKRSIEYGNRARAQSLSVDVSRIISALETAKVRAEEIQRVLKSWEER